LRIAHAPIGRLASLARQEAPQADAYADLAEVLPLANRPREAAEALEQALTRYERTSSWPGASELVCRS